MGVLVVEFFLFFFYFFFIYLGGGERGDFFLDFLKGGGGAAIPSSHTVLQEDLASTPHILLPHPTTTSSLLGPLTCQFQNHPMSHVDLRNTLCHVVFFPSCHEAPCRMSILRNGHGVLSNLGVKNPPPPPPIGITLPLTIPE